MNEVYLPTKHLMSDPPPKPKVLLVDDNETIRSTLSMILKRAEFEVVEAGNVNEALALIPTQVFDAIVIERRSFSYHDESLHVVLHPKYY